MLAKIILQCAYNVYDNVTSIYFLPMALSNAMMPKSRSIPDKHIFPKKHPVSTRVPTTRHGESNQLTRFCFILQGTGQYSAFTSLHNHRRRHGGCFAPKYQRFQSCLC